MKNLLLYRAGLITEGCLPDADRVAAEAEGVIDLAQYQEKWEKGEA